MSFINSNLFLSYFFSTSFGINIVKELSDLVRATYNLCFVLLSSVFSFSKYAAKSVVNYNKQLVASCPLILSIELT